MNITKRYIKEIQGLKRCSICGRRVALNAGKCISCTYPTPTPDELGGKKWK